MDLFPIMGAAHGRDDYTRINLSKPHLTDLKVSSESDLKKYLAEQHQQAKARFLWGGYLEHRSLYQSDLFLGDQEAIRDVHLGIDIWGIVYDLVFAPLDGIIHSFAYNDRHLDYGFTLILEHKIQNEKIYALYGHLAPTYYHTWEKGRKVKAGEVIADLGPKETNGGWLPHLHFQLIKDMEGREGDFPGVCSAEDREHYREICPDPWEWIVPLNEGTA